MKTSRSVVENGETTQIVSVFRRPIISTNLHFKTSTLAFGPPSPITNIMFDGREPTLFTQAASATMGHAQALAPPTQEQLQQMVDFETGALLQRRLGSDGAGRRVRRAVRDGAHRSGEAGPRQLPERAVTM